MAKFRQHILNKGTPMSARSRDAGNASRWSCYLHHEASASASASRVLMDYENPPSIESYEKALCLEPGLQLAEVADGLLTKMYKLTQILDNPDPVSFMFTESFWSAGIIPNFPRICLLVAKRFPEHPNNLQLERVDKAAMNSLHENTLGYMESLEPWVMLLLDLMLFHEEALRLILDLSSTVITLMPHQNSPILHAFMNLFCALVRVNLFSEKIPRKMMLQMYNLLHTFLRGGRDCDFYHRLVQFVDSYDPPVVGLQENLNVVSPRVGEVLDAVAPTIFLSADTRKLRNEGFLSPFHPRFPEILTNSAHPLRAQDLANVTAYREWVLFGYLVCPNELLRGTSIDIVMAVLKENLVVPLFREEHILLHEYYQMYVLPRILQSKKAAKSGRSKQKEADLLYNIAKKVLKMISEAHEQALVSCDLIHRKRRILLQQEIGKMIIFFTDQPSLIAPNIQMVFSALALAQDEVLWYFQHVGVETSKSKVVRMVPINIDATDSSIGFLLNGMDRLCSLIHKYTAAIRGYALSYLSSSGGRIRLLLGAPGMVALDLDGTLERLFQQIVSYLDDIPKPQGGSISSVTRDLSNLRKDWLSVLMIVTSSHSSINIRHLEKATISTGKEGLLSEGNNAYYWSRCVDQLEVQTLKNGSLKKLYFYRQHLITVFKNTMFGPEGRPQHCCAWLGVASSFPNCASPIIPEEFTQMSRDSILYVESLIESISGGLEGLINILDSEAGFGSLDMQLLPGQAAVHLNQKTSTASSTRSPRPVSGNLLPGHESSPENNSSLKMLEAAMQRLTNLCTVLNDMEPICVLNHVFVLREYMREAILGNFKKRLHAIVKIENDIQKPSALESLIRRHLGVVHLAEQHISMDITQGIRDILLEEAFSGPMLSSHSFQNPVQETDSVVEVVCKWYLDNIVKDASGAGILFARLHKCFKSARPIGQYFAESLTDVREMESFVRIFGHYGVDRLNSLMREHIAALLNCIDTTLRLNHEALEGIASSLANSEHREASLKQLVDIETAISFCIQVGNALEFGQILAQAAGSVLEANAPLIHSLFQAVTTHLPDNSHEKEDIRRLMRAANSIGAVRGYDVEWVHSVLVDVGSAHGDSWSFLPYLFAAFMTSEIWNECTFIVDTGSFNNNIYCLARCVNSLIAGSALVRLQMDEQKCSLPYARELEHKANVEMSHETNIKLVMELFVKYSAQIVFDSLSRSGRSQVAPKLIFLEQLCELSPYLARSTLELYVPYAIFRSVYRQYYGKLPSLPLSMLNHPPKHSTVASLSSLTAHSSYGDSAQQCDFTGSCYKASAHDRERVCRAGSGLLRVGHSKLRHIQGSGPLEYNSIRKVKFVDGFNSSSTGPSPLPRFAVSR